MFVNRRKELSTLNSYLDMILSGQNVNVSLFGQRRTGKTELLRKFKKDAERYAIIPYVNLERSIPRMDNFSLHFVTELVRSATGDIDTDMDWSQLIVSSQNIGKRTQDSIARLINQLEKEKKDIDTIGEALFRIPKLVSDEKELPVIYIIDEFQEIKGIHDRILHIMRANTEKVDSVNYWVAGSIFSAFNDIFKGKSPFYGQFRRMDLTRFDRGSTYELVDGLLPFTVPAEHKKIIFKATGGNPFFITAMCRRFHVMSSLMDDPGIDVLKKSIILEVFDETGIINGHFEYILDVSLSRFRNTRVYHDILLHISNKNDNLAGISSAVGKPSGEVSNYMKALLRTDMIIKEDDRYTMVDPLMGTWFSNRYRRDDSFLDMNIREKVFEDLLESYSAVSTELGRSKEVELRDKLTKKYEMNLKPYSTPDGQIELDLVGKKDGYHIFEIKWRNRPVDIGTMRRFRLKVENSKYSLKESTLYMISKGGFDRKSLDYASKHGIRCLNGSLDQVKKRSKQMKADRRTSGRN